MTERARSNAELVEKAIGLAPLLDRKPVGPEETRGLLRLASRDMP
jgi:uncharacterized protein (DUF849 family)